MTQNKIRIVIFEGAEKVGKTYMTNLLTSTLPRAQFLSIISPEDKIQKHGVEEKKQLIEDYFRTADPDKIHVIDRWILTDLIYNPVTSGDSVVGLRALMKKFSQEFDVLCVKLDRPNTKVDYEDSKIKLDAKTLNCIIHTYRYEKFDGCINWSRTLVDADGKMDFSKALDLLHDIAFAFEIQKSNLNRVELLQEHYASDFWKFGVSCICLNNTTGYRARRIVPEVFHHLPNPRSFLNLPFNLSDMVKPLGMQNIRTKMLLQFTEDVINSGEYGLYENCELPQFHGVGKYFRDSHRLFIRKINDVSQYNQPLDKELATVLQSGGVL